MEIISAAISYYLFDKRLIFSMPRPFRHSDILHSMSWILGRSVCTNNLQGFIANDGNFYKREEAFKIAEKAGQLLESEKDSPTRKMRELYSEDLW